jgi:SAM-dependent methyltransferase
MAAFFGTLLFCFSVAPDGDLTSELAEEIRSAVAEASPAAPPRPAAATGLEGDEDVRVSLTRALEHVTPAVPPAARLSGSKRFLIRALRFLWRDQATFNAMLLEAANALAERLKQTARGLRGLEEELGGLRSELDNTRAALTERVGKWSAGWERRSSIQDGRLVILERGQDDLRAVIEAEIRDRTAGLERRIAIEEGRLEMQEAGGPAPPAETPQPSPARHLPPAVYSLFEERFRGSPEEVADKQKFYLPFLDGIQGPVLDVGCGRGEFLTLLKERGIAASGVEINPIAVEACREKDLTVEEGDGLAALTEKPEKSLGAVVAFQVVEHWSPETVFAFLREARRALASSGILVLETINTDSFSSLRAFFLDPSHVRPVPPEALRFLAEAAGFVQARIEYRAPLDASDRLEESSENDAKLNRLLFGPQDYALIARVPRAAR